MRIYSLILLLFYMTPLCQGYWHWETVTIMKNNYRSDFYDSSIIDPKINCSINNRMIIRENKPLYEKMVRTLKSLISKQKSITLELTNIILKDSEFWFYWIIHMNIFQYMFFIDGLSIYKTDKNGNVMTHLLHFKESGCKNHIPYEFYIHPSRFVKIPKNGS